MSKSRANALRLKGKIKDIGIVCQHCGGTKWRYQQTLNSEGVFDLYHCANCDRSLFVVVEKQGA